MNIGRKWLPVLLAIALAIFATHMHASSEPEDSMHTATSSAQQMHDHTGHEHSSGGCTADCCALGLCFFLAVAFQSATTAIYSRSSFFAEDGPLWHPRRSRPLVPPPKLMRAVL